jgi:hypothetical protein
MEKLITAIALLCIAIGVLAGVVGFLYFVTR